MTFCLSAALQQYLSEKMLFPCYQSCTHTHTRFLTALFPGLLRSASTREVKPIWILLKQETVSASGISCAICKSAPCSRQITRPAPRRFFTGRMPFLPPNQQHQSTEGIQCSTFPNNWHSTQCRHGELFDFVDIRWLDALCPVLVMFGVYIDLFYKWKIVCL